MKFNEDFLIEANLPFNKIDKNKILIYNKDSTDLPDMFLIYLGTKDAHNNSLLQIKQVLNKYNVLFSCGSSI